MVSRKRLYRNALPDELKQAHLGGAADLYLRPSYLKSSKGALILTYRVKIVLPLN